MFQLAIFSVLALFLVPQTRLLADEHALGEVRGREVVEEITRLYPEIRRVNVAMPRDLDHPKEFCLNLRNKAQRDIEERGDVFWTLRYVEPDCVAYFVEKRDLQTSGARLLMNELFGKKLSAPTWGEFSIDPERSDSGNFRYSSIPYEPAGLMFLKNAAYDSELITDETHKRVIGVRVNAKYAERYRSEALRQTDAQWGSMGQSFHILGSYGKSGKLAIEVYPTPYRKVPGEPASKLWIGYSKGLNPGSKVDTWSPIEVTQKEPWVTPILETRAEREERKKALLQELETAREGAKLNGSTGYTMQMSRLWEALDKIEKSK